MGRDLVYIHGGMSYSEQDPKKFYAGYDTGWGAIVRKFDVPRRISTDLLQQAVFDETSTTDPRLCVLKGPAGSGKTIALKRVAWEVAALDQVVFWLESGGDLNKDVLFEFYDLTGKRIFVFVDHVALHQAQVDGLLKAATQRRIPITVVAAERDGDWSAYCTQLQSAWRPADLHTSRLSRTEIEALLDLLGQYGSLGLLEGKPRTEQVEAFTVLADRQLLVALHEATHGKRFEDIIYEEYRDLVPDTARQLYLDICTLNQFSVPVRAGTISRISGIRFRDYERDFLGPLKNVVLTERDPTTGDYRYKARHSRVAQFVFEQACSIDSEKTKQFLRLIDGMDIGYTVDHEALTHLTRGRSMAGYFRTAQAGREIYEVVFDAFPGNAFLYQQASIFELNHSDGDLQLAEARARQARELDPRSTSIIHTQAEIARRRANDQESAILKEQFRRQTRERLEEIGSSRNDRYAASTRCKLLVDEVGDLTKQMRDDDRPQTAMLFSDKVKDTEIALSRALQIYSDDAEFSQIEARFRTILEQNERAVSALERAWGANPRGSSVAVRLANAYSNRGEKELGLRILEEELTRNPDDKLARLEIAKHLINFEPIQEAVIEAHLSRSFSKNDLNFEARYLYGQFLFYLKKGAEAFATFEELDRTSPVEFRRRPQSTLVSQLLPRFNGGVLKREATYLFIQLDGYPQNIYANEGATSQEIWDQLYDGAPINFSLMFNRQGPVATEIRLSE